MSTNFCSGLRKQTQLLCCGWWYLPWPPACLYPFCPSYSSSAAATGEGLKGTTSACFVWWNWFVTLASLWHPSTCSSLFFRRALIQRPAGYPEETGIYQDQMPLYINCTEVSHIYTNGSYQLVYQNSTPVFVNTKQVPNCLQLFNF